MRAKLGIFNSEEDDINIISYLLSIMKNYKADYTNTFRDLTLGNLAESEIFKK